MQLIHLYIITKENIRYIKGRPSKMNDNRVPFKCTVNKIITNTSNITNLFQAFPVFYNTELSGHFSFFKNFIEYINFIKTILW